MQPSPFTRLRWRVEELWRLDDTKIIGGLLLIASLTFAGFLAARMVSRASAGSPPGTRIVTAQQKVRAPQYGQIITHWRVRRLYSQAQTVLRTQTVSSPTGTRLVRHPVIRYRVVYRTRLITVPAKTVIRQVTESHVVTVTRRVTVAQTTTAVSTETKTLPITVTVPVP